MSKYFFNVYEIDKKCTSYGEYRESDWTPVGGIEYYEGPMQVRPNTYRFNSYDGSFSVSDSGGYVWVDWDNRYEYFHVKEGDSLKRIIYEWDNRIKKTKITEFRRTSRYVTTGETCRDVRGRYLRTITGNINDYPSNGIRGGYWYVRGGLDESPSVIYPTTGDTVSHLTMVEWDTSVEYGTGTESVYIQISTDGGSTWEDLFRHGPSSYSKGKMEYDLNRFGTSSRTKLRMFAVINGDMTTPNETGEFTLIKNVPPNNTITDIPSGKRFYSKDDMVNLTWTFDDDDIDEGDYQSNARIAIFKKETKDIVKEFIVQGEATSFNIPLQDLPSKTEYDVKVYPRDRMGVEPYHTMYGREDFWVLHFRPEVHFNISGTVNDKKLDSSITTNFNKSSGMIFLYDSEWNEIEEARLYSDGTFEFGTELENLKTYNLKAEVYKGIDEIYGAGKVGDYFHTFKVELDPPPKPKLKYTVNSEGVELEPILVEVEGEPKPVRGGLQKYVNGRWVTLTNDYNGYFFDRFAISGTTPYRAIAYSEEGSASYSDPENVPFKLEHPMLTNLRTLETIALEGIIKTDLKYTPDTSYFKVIGSNSLIKESGGYVERKLSLEWEIYDIVSLNRYKDFLWYDDLYLYRDGEGRYLRVSFESIEERETYNPHWFYLSVEAIEVAEV